jgi:ABC-type phosphate/phosphonate transport system permease subunit
MKKQILFGILGILFLLLITPVIPASQYTQIENNKQQIIDEYKQTIIATFDDLESYIKNHESSVETSVVLINNIEDIKEVILTNMNPSDNGFIANLILSLLYAILGTIFGILFGPILALIILILVSPALLLAKVISSIINGFNPQTQ